MIGRFQVPVADHALTTAGFETCAGEVIALGERPPVARLDAAAASRLAIGETITNLASAPIGALSRIKLSCNWMAAAGHPGEDANLYAAVRAASECAVALGIAIPVGKDSMSMRTVWADAGTPAVARTRTNAKTTRRDPVSSAEDTLAELERQMIGEPGLDPETVELRELAREAARRNFAHGLVDPDGDLGVPVDDGDAFDQQATLRIALRDVGTSRYGSRDKDLDNPRRGTLGPAEDPEPAVFDELDPPTVPREVELPPRIVHAIDSDELDPPTDVRSEPLPGASSLGLPFDEDIAVASQLDDEPLTIPITIDPRHLDAATVEAERAIASAVAAVDTLATRVAGGTTSFAASAHDRSAAAQRRADKTIVSPVTLIVTAFGPVEDVRLDVTPELRGEGHALLLVDLGAGRCRLGGSALAQVYGQLGDAPADLDDPRRLHDFYDAIQGLVAERRLTAYHDRSDGGLAATVLEMAFASGLGLELDVTGVHVDPFAALFSEELGAVIEVAADDVAEVRARLVAAGAQVHGIGHAVAGDRVQITHAGKQVVDATRTRLRARWSHVTHQLALRRDDPTCAAEEHAARLDPEAPGLHAKLTFDVDAPAVVTGARPRVAILREQGVNGQIEMAAAFTRAGFDAVDVHMTDLIEAVSTSPACAARSRAAGSPSVTCSAPAAAGPPRCATTAARATSSRRSPRVATRSCSGCATAARRSPISPTSCPVPPRGRAS